MPIAQPGDPIYPVTAMSSGPIPDLGVILVQFDFLSNPQQKLAEAMPGPNYALTPRQVRDLIEELQKHLRTLGSAKPPSA
jgi:hypothetical protein